MPVPTPTVKWDPDCDQLFRNEKEHQVVSWFRTHAAYFDPDGGSVQASDYDEALIMNGPHGGSSYTDPNPQPHTTVRLSNAAMRQAGRFRTLHLRLEGTTVVLRRDTTEAAVDKKAENRRKKKERQRLRRNAEKKRKDDKDDGGAGPVAWQGT